MTYVYTKRTYNGGVTDVPTIIKVEYVLSSLTKLIKVVDMWVDGKFHRLNWMSKDGQANLMDELERDYLNNYSAVS
jgi:hypothetical protein